MIQNVYARHVTQSALWLFFLVQGHIKKSSKGKKKRKADAAERASTIYSEQKPPSDTSRALLLVVKVSSSSLLGLVERPMLHSHSVQCGNDKSAVARVSKQTI